MALATAGPIGVPLPSFAAMVQQAPDRFDLTLLNPPQRQAVLHDEGPLLVLAGAGSGKTRVIIYRIARLLRDGVPPDRILGVTFTNKSAREMRERLAALAGRRGREVTLSTFHSLGLTIIKAEHKAAGLPKNFCIYDTSDQLSLVRELLRRVKVAERRLDVARILQIILDTKKKRRKEVALDWGDDYELAAYDLYPRYVEQMSAFNAVDFDDLLLRAQDVLQDPDARERWRERFEYLLVDEYQDTSPDQLELLRVLAGDRLNVCAVGDDDQSIYAWRGAAVGNILAFGKHFKGTCEVVLDQNYRSTGNILAAANSVIRNNSERKVKRLWSQSGDGDPVEVVACCDAEDEACFVAEQVGRLAYEGVPYEDVAVLYRSNHQSRLFEENLALERIPFRVVGGQAFFERKEVRDALAYLGLAVNPNDEVSLRRVINVPPRGVGPTSVARLAAFAEACGCSLWVAAGNAAQAPGMPKGALAGLQSLVATMSQASRDLEAAQPGHAAQRVQQLWDKLGLRDAILEADDAPSISARRLENLDEVVHGLARFEAGLPPHAEPLTEFLRSAALASQPEEDEDGKGKVSLMTLHSAKGLEFQYVFMVGIEDELLPHRRTLELGGELGEERRLCYVGMTRARKGLWMLHAAKRQRYGKLESRTPSRFLDELPADTGVKRWSREAPPDDDACEQKAEEFFARMRAQLGIDEDEAAG